MKKNNSNNIKIEELIKNNFDFSKIKIGLVTSVFNQEISQDLQSEVLKELKKYDIKI